MNPKNMNEKNSIKTDIVDALQSTSFAVLATECDGQPHASLIAFTPMDGLRQLIFATYRSTRKFQNLSQNGKVAILIEGRNTNSSGMQDDFVLTAFGQAEEIRVTENEEALKAHLEKHPDMESFLLTADCALVRVTVNAYQVVRGIDDVRWWTISELNTI